MPTTFSGSYLQEPADLRSAGITERTIIVACDATGLLVVSNRTFADLSTEEKATIVAEANTTITIAEGELDAYATRRGYQTPITAVTVTVKAIAARIAAVMFNLRAKAIGPEQAERQLNDIRSGVLTDIALGRLPLIGADMISSPTSALSSQIHAITDAASRDVNGEVFRATRATLRRF